MVGGSLDEDDFLFLTGRRNELINRGGEKIAPSEVDQALHAHPAVVEAAALAVLDARLGEDIVAAVVLAHDATIRPWALRAWLLGRLSPPKIPRRVWVVDTTPRTATGKVQRAVLAERFSNRHGVGYRLALEARQRPGQTVKRDEGRPAARGHDLDGVDQGP